MFLGSPSSWWRRLDLSGLNEPLQASKKPYSDFLKCFWQALKRLPSLTKMGSIKMSDERNVFLLLPWFWFSIRAASMRSLSPTSRRWYQPITRLLIKWVHGHLGNWLKTHRLDSLLQKKKRTNKVQDEHLIRLLGLQAWDTKVMFSWFRRGSDKNFVSGGGVNK